MQFGMFTPTAVYAATEDWASADESGLDRRVQRAAGELADELARREPVAVPDPFALTTPFEQLLS